MIHRYNHDQPDYIRPSELQSLLEHIGRMHPTQFIFEMSVFYHKDNNYTYVEILTTGEKFPGQYGFLKPGQHRDLNG